jgi:NitT/TauT family transport system substrate-binding protein
MAIMQVSAVPVYLNTTNPNVRTLTDFGPGDRIAVPTIKTSSQALLLQMAARNLFGPERYTHFDTLTVPMSPPDAHIALMSGVNTVTANFTTPPFLYDQISSGKARKVTSLSEIMGGPGATIVSYARARFHDDNPTIYAAYAAAIETAMRQIREAPDRAAELYIRNESSKLSPTFIKEMIVDPEMIFDKAPLRMMQFAEFMADIGLIKERPKHWTDLFFPEIHNSAGS